MKCQDCDGYMERIKEHKSVDMHRCMKCGKVVSALNSEKNCW